MPLEKLTNENLFEYAASKTFEEFYNALEELPETNINYAVRDKNGYTVLHILAQRTNEDNSPFLEKLIDKLIAQGLDPSLICLRGFLPIHFALMHKCQNIFRILLEKSDLSIKVNRSTLLHFAIEHYQEGIFLLLLEKITYQDIFAQEVSENLTPLLLAQKMFKQGKLSGSQLDFIGTKLNFCLKKFLSGEDLSSAAKGSVEDYKAITGTQQFTRGFQEDTLSYQTAKRKLEFNDETKKGILEDRDREIEMQKEIIRGLELKAQRWKFFTKGVENKCKQIKRQQDGLERQQGELERKNKLIRGMRKEINKLKEINSDLEKEELRFLPEDSSGSEDNEVQDFIETGNKRIDGSRSRF